MRSVLKRSIYRGTLIYNKTKKRLPDGSRKGRQRKRPESEWVKIDVPQLRVIDAQLAERVDERMEGRRHTYLRTATGRLLGRPAEGTRLLSGFIICECGSRFEAVKNWGWKSANAYVCSARRRKGTSICASPITFGVEEMEQVFLDQIEGSVLHPDFIDRVVEAVFANDPNAELEALRDERAQLCRELENLTRAIASGGDIPALAAALAERDKRLRILDAKLAKPVALPQRDLLRAALTLRGSEWRNVLRGPHIAQARLVLQHLIDLPIRVLNQPIPKYIKQGDTRGIWRANTRPGGLLAGIVQSVASPSGTDCSYKAINRWIAA